MQDSIGDRFKDYENRTRYMLPRRCYTICRIDGKAFHSFTKHMERPFDESFMKMMNDTAVYLCKNIQGAQFAYVQSDEISILLTDFEKPTTCAWFDNNVQKMASISASMATREFNRSLMEYRYVAAKTDKERLIDYCALHADCISLAEFDSRVFTLSDIYEVENYLVFRQKDATRNAITAVAQSLYSHKELHGKSSSEKQEMIFQKGQNFNEYPAGCKRGRFIKKEQEKVDIPIRGRTKLAVMLDDKAYFEKDVIRNKWVVVEPPIFTQDRKFLRNLIPVIPQFEEIEEDKNEKSI